jgi:hypothetical protein
MTAPTLGPEADLLWGQIDELVAEGGEADPFGSVAERLLPHFARLVHEAVLEDDESFYTRDAILAVGAHCALILADGDAENARAVTAAIAAERSPAGGRAIPASRDPGGRFSHGFITEALSLLGYEYSLPAGERDLEFALEAIIGAAMRSALGMRLEASLRLLEGEPEGAHPEALGR